MKNLGRVFVLFGIVITLNLYFLAKKQEGINLVIDWRTLSQIFSLIGITLLSVSFLLSSRLRFLDKWFGGFDHVYQLHHQTGAWAFMFILHHPIFLAIEALPNTKLSQSYLWFSKSLPNNFGVAALFLMTLLLILTLLINLPYQWWKKTHELMGIVLGLSIVHILFIGSDVSQYLPLKIWVVMLLGLSAFSEIYVRFLHKYIGPRFRYIVESVVRKGDILDITFIPEGKSMKYYSGQFIFAQFEKLGGEIHPFSIASKGGSDRIRLGIKILGDYTLNLRDIKVGDRVIFWGPYGQFYMGAKNKRNLLCIAGGIGITPFLGLLADEINTERKIDLIYCVSDDNEAIYDEELTMTRNNQNINYMKHQSASLGRITVEKIYAKLGDLSDRKILLCGPEKMMLSLIDQFKKSGVRNRDLVYENFNFK